jgi:hypothetical protein
MRVLTLGNAKTVRGESLGYLTGILHLDPATNNRLCPFKTVYCAAICLVNSGRAEFLPSINLARARKTREFFANKQAFCEQLKKDIRALIRRAKKLGLKPAVRLNGTSDIIWERLLDFAEFPGVQFYDYTKIPLTARRESANYYLTFSFSGTNWLDCESALAQDHNVAVVFNCKQADLPLFYRGYKVIDGVEHDLRFLDGKQGAIVGLIPKGKRAKLAAKEGTPFIVQLAA